MVDVVEVSIKTSLASSCSVFSQPFQDEGQAGGCAHPSQPRRAGHTVL